jgi:hypothetical protein
MVLHQFSLVIAIGFQHSRSSVRAKCGSKFPKEIEGTGISDAGYKVVVEVVDAGFREFVSRDALEGCECQGSTLPTMRGKRPVLAEHN